MGRIGYTLVCSCCKAATSECSQPNLLQQSYSKNDNPSDRLFSSLHKGELSSPGSSKVLRTFGVLTVILSRLCWTFHLNVCCTVNAPVLEEPGEEEISELVQLIIELAIYTQNSSPLQKIASAGGNPFPGNQTL